MTSESLKRIHVNLRGDKHYRDKSPREASPVTPPRKSRDGRRGGSWKCGHRQVSRSCCVAAPSHELQTCSFWTRKSFTASDRISLEGSLPFTSLHHVGRASGWVEKLVCLSLGKRFTGTASSTVHGNHQPHFPSLPSLSHLLLIQLSPWRWVPASEKKGHTIAWGCLPAGLSSRRRAGGGSSAADGEQLAG